MTKNVKKYLSLKKKYESEENDFIQLEIENAPGGLIRDQESQNYDLSFRKIYNGN